jgi:hypothetical protein
MPPISLPAAGGGYQLQGPVGGGADGKIAAAKRALQDLTEGTFQGDDALAATGGQWGEDSMGKYFFWDSDALGMFSFLFFFHTRHHSAWHPFVGQHGYVAFCAARLFIGF